MSGLFTTTKNYEIIISEKYFDKFIKRNNKRILLIIFWVKINSI